MIGIRFASFGVALFVALLLPLNAASAKAKPTCHGKKATIVAGAGNNRIVVRHSGHGKQVVVAGAGNDVILTGNGSDVICAGGGNDRVMGGRGTDRVYAGAGDDLILNVKGKDSSFGENGNDQLYGGPSTDSMDGGPGDDLINGSSDRDRLRGAIGDDLILGDDGGDAISGDDGNDEIHGGSGGEEMSGGDGDDRMYGGLLDDRMDGEPGTDLLIGGHGTDEMSGGSGKDWLRGGSNGDDYAGGDGSDTISFADNSPSLDTTTGIDVNLSTRSAITPDGDERVSGVENVLGSAFDDTIRGTAASDGLDGGPGDDTIAGTAGADLLTGGPGNDVCDARPEDLMTICGLGAVAENPRDARPSVAYAYLDPRGPDPGLYVLGQPGVGADDLVVSADGAMFTVISRTGAPIARLSASINACAPVGRAVSCQSPAEPLSFVAVWGDDGNDQLRLAGDYSSKLSAVVNGGPGNDMIDGSSRDDVLFSGQSGSDSLNGGDGSDALLAVGTGGDRLDGGGGNDQLVSEDVCQGHAYDGGPGYDIAGFARYSFAPRNGVKATLGGTAVDPNRGGCAETELAADLEILEGSSGPDVLTGTNGKDVLVLGGGGDDVIDGLGAADTIDGGAGSDALLGGAGFDTLQSKDGTRDKTVDCGAGGGQAFRDNADPVTDCKMLEASKRKPKNR